MYPVAEYVRRAEQLAKLLSQGLIFPSEYAKNLISSAALYDVDDDTARSVASGVPSEARTVLDAEISIVLAPDYVRPIAGIEFERDRIQSERTRRVRACAEHLRRYLQANASAPPTR